MNTELTKDDLNLIYFENFIELITEIILKDINDNKSNYINENTNVA